MTKPIQIKNLTIGAGIPKICVPLTGTTREKICQEAEDAKKAAADLVEWRADFFEELMNPEACQNVLEALAEILGETPLLFTIRTSEEGGNITISLEDHAACNIILQKAKKQIWLTWKLWVIQKRRKSWWQSFKKKESK